MTKINIGLKSGKTINKEIEDSSVLLGKNIGDKIIGDNIGMQGYEFEITGGSDDCGFPMRPGIQGQGRKKILAKGGVGIRKNKGRIKKTVRGQTIGTSIVQVNLKVIKEGKKALDTEEPTQSEEEQPKETSPEKEQTEEPTQKKEKKEEPKTKETKE